MVRFTYTQSFSRVNIVLQDLVSGTKDVEMRIRRADDKLYGDFSTEKGVVTLTDTLLNNQMYPTGYSGEP